LKNDPILKKEQGQKMTLKKLAQETVITRQSADASLVKDTILRTKMLNLGLIHLNSFLNCLVQNQKVVV